MVEEEGKMVGCAVRQLLLRWDPGGGKPDTLGQWELVSAV